MYSLWFIIAPRPPAQGDAAHMNWALPHQLSRKCPRGQSDGGTFSSCLFCIKLTEGKELRRTSWSSAVENVGWCPNKQRSRFQSLATAVVLLVRLWRLQHHPGVRDVQLGYPGVLRATDSFVSSHTPLPVDSVRYLPVGLSLTSSSWR